MEERVKKLIKKHEKDKDLTKEKIEPGWDWSDADLKGFNFKNQNLSEKSKPANFKKTNLERAHLERTNLIGAYLIETCLVRAHLERADLIETHLEKADLRNAYLKGAILTFAHLEKADLRGANLEGALLGWTYLEDAYLSYVNLEGANLLGAHLERADLRGANLKSTNFDRARLELTNLNNVNFEYSDNFEFTKFKRIDETEVEDALITYVRLERFFKKIERNDRAGDFYFGKKIMQRKIYLEKWNLLSWLWSHLFSKLCGYGEHVWKIVAIIFGILILFTGIYYLGDGIARNDDFSYNSSISECGYFSVVTFTTLGFGDYEPKPHFQGFAAFEALLGYFMLSLFVITLARKVMR